MQKGELKLRDQEEEATFNVFNAMKFLATSDYCFRTNLRDAVVSN